MRGWRRPSRCHPPASAGSRTPSIPHAPPLPSSARSRTAGTSCPDGRQGRRHSGLHTHVLHISLWVGPLPQLVSIAERLVDAQLPVIAQHDLTRSSGRGVEPSKLIPSLLYPEPWHGHLNLFSGPSHRGGVPGLARLLCRAPYVAFMSDHCRWSEPDSSGAVASARAAGRSSISART